MTEKNYYPTLVEERTEESEYDWLDVIAKSDPAIAAFAREFSSDPKQLDLPVFYKGPISVNVRKVEVTAYHAKEEIYQKSFTTPQAVANFFLDAAKDSMDQLSPLRLIKLVCIAHGWVLACLENPLFDEKIEAWSFGPVVPSLYHEFKDFRKNPINRYAIDYQFFGEVSIPKLPKESEVLAELLLRVWEIYKGYSAAQLVALTHAEGTPWTETTKQGAQKIPNSLIKQHYKTLLEKMHSEFK